MGKHIPAHAALDKRTARILAFIRFINMFRRTKRTIKYKGNDQLELNGDHSYQLAMVAWFIRDRHLIHLDALKIQNYCLVHDIPEIYAGDTPAFPDKNGEYSGNTLSHASKKRREKKAVERIKREWTKHFPAMIEFILDYENQADEESRFVYALDKFLSDLNIYEDGGRTNIDLEITLKKQSAYKRPRIRKHPFLLELYDDFVAFCEYRPDVNFQPKQEAAE